MPLIVNNDSYIDNSQFPVSAVGSSYISHDPEKDNKAETVQTVVKKDIADLLRKKKQNTQHNTETYRHLEYACNYIGKISSSSSALGNIHPNDFTVRLFGIHGIVSFSSEGLYLARFNGIIQRVQDLYDESKMLNIRP